MRCLCGLRVVLRVVVGVGVGGRVTDAIDGVTTLMAVMDPTHDEDKNRTE